MGIQQVRNELRRRQHVLNADVLADFKKAPSPVRAGMGGKKGLNRNKGDLLRLQYRVHHLRLGGTLPLKPATNELTQETQGRLPNSDMR